MSHVAEACVKPGEPQIKDLRALKLACENLGLEFELPSGSHIEAFETANGDIRTKVIGADGKSVQNNLHFRTWKDDHGGKLVGDYRQEGWSEQQLGDNAVAVIKLSAKQKQKLPGAYEIGVVPDRHNPGCWVTQHDFYSGGYGLEDIVGATKLKNGKPEVMAPTLLMHYNMMVDKLAAAEHGDEIEFKQNADGSWISEARTTARVGA